MKPYKQIRIGDVYNVGIDRNEWVVVDKRDDEKMICVKMIPRSSNYPESLNRPIWKKNTDRMFNHCVLEARHFQHNK